MQLIVQSSLYKSYRTFIQNVGWNIIGQIAPLLAALVSIPLLVKGLGVDRFGILTIAWALIGYFSLFDFGIGRALTQLVAESLVSQKSKDLAALIWTGLTLMLGLGIVASIIIIALSDWIVLSALNIHPDIQLEVKGSLYMLAPSIPLAVLAVGLRGILEAKQEFKATNLARGPLGALLFIGPLFVLPISNSLIAVFFVLTLIRLLTAIVFYCLCRRSFTCLKNFNLSLDVLPKLLNFGGWMTVSNVVSPLMVQMDRFVIGAMLSTAAVAFYTTPYEIVTKLLVIPVSIAGVCFPMFSKLMAEGETKKALDLYATSCKYTFVLMVPLLIFVEIFAGPLLSCWLTDDFAAESSNVLRILAVGVFVNGLAFIPFAYLQGRGRSDITAKLHLAELMVYLPLVVALIKLFGITGAAAAWSLRAVADYIGLLVFVRRIHDE